MLMNEAGSLVGKTSHDQQSRRHPRAVPVRDPGGGDPARVDLGHAGLRADLFRQLGITLSNQSTRSGELARR